MPEELGNKPKGDDEDDEPGKPEMEYGQDAKALYVEFLKLQIA